MESDGTTMSEKQNNETSGAALILNDRCPVRVEGESSRRARSGRHYILITFFILFVVLFLIMTTLFVLEKMKAGEQSSSLSVVQDSSGPLPKKVCKTPDCIITISDLMQSIDPRKDPCANFYQYACNGWIAKNPVPKGRESWDQWSLLEGKVEAFLVKILQDKDVRKSYSNIAAVAKSFDYYEACISLQEKSPSKETPLLDLVKKYLSWPIVDPKWNESPYNLETILARFSRDLGMNPFFEFIIQSDLKNSSLNMINIQQTFLFSLFHGQLIHNYTGSIMARSVYVDLIYNMSMILGAKDANQTRKDAEEILGVEQAIAKTGKGYVDFSEEDYYGKYKISELMKETGSSPINWVTFINEVLRLVNHKVTADEYVIVTDIEVIKKMINMLRKLPKRTLLNYLGWKIIVANYEYVSKEFDNIRKVFRKGAWNVNSFKTKEQCVVNLKEYFGMPISRVYVDKKFSGKSKQLAQNMASVITTVFQETLESNDWMDEKSKQAAIEKAKFLRGNYGYPDFILDNDRLNAQFERIKINKDSMFDSMLSIKSSKRTGDLLLFRKAIDRSKWTETPLLVNPYYSPVYNTMSFQAAFLQPPFYDQKYLRAISFGGVGAIIAHELLHGFDTSGSKFDKNGNNVQWWTDATIAKYENRTQCLLEQYDGYIYEGFEVDGEATLGENIGDNVGMRESFKAYQRWIELNGEEPRLPGTLFSNEQIFFLSFARNWCKNLKPPAIEFEVYGEHSPAPFRVNGPLQNFPQFSKVFNCPVGSYMNPAKKCETW